jgi:fatty-acyl-CoA synthase
MSNEKSKGAHVELAQSKLHRPLYTTDLLVNALNQDADRPLLKSADGATITVGDMRGATSRFAQALADLGVTRAAKVALLARNRLEVLQAWSAVHINQGVYVPLHPLASLYDHLHVIRDAQIQILIFDAQSFAERALALAVEEPRLRLVSLGPCKTIQDLIAHAATKVPARLVAPLVEPNDTMRLAYTGGTTGTPKSIAISQNVTLAYTTIMLAAWEWPNEPRVLSCAPLSHAGGTMFLPTLLKGGTMLVLPSFDALAVLKAIEEHKINCVMLVPSMIYALLDHPRFDEFDLSSLETVFYGASLMSPVRLKEAIERIGPVFFQFYGQAEAPMTITVMRKAEHDVEDAQRLASCGRPPPWLHVELLDADNQPVQDGDPGEICVRGPIVVSGYQNAPEQNAVTFSGDWLHTGDVAVRDAGGFLRILDRKKDMIITGGFNVYSAEIEDILAGHPAVAQVAVVGVPHPKWGEAVKAFVVCRPGMTVSAETLIDLVVNLKGSFQAPKFVEMVDAIPLTPVGKPDKKALRLARSSSSTR